LTLLDNIELGRNAEVSVEARFFLAVTPDTVAMNVLVESMDLDGVASLRLGNDCLFLAEIAHGDLQPGQWIRASIPFEKLELWPYDSGSFTVTES
jgi:hypothetical protein